MPVLVLGGAGALGRSLVTHLARGGLQPISADLQPNAEALASLLLPPGATLADTLQLLRAHLGGQAPLRAILCAAGAWAGGGAGDTDFEHTFQRMHAANLQPALAAAALAAGGQLAPGGLLLLTGSAAALRPAPAMLGYALAKGATHALARELAAPGSGLPRGATVLCLAPHVLDTPSNRAGLAGGAPAPPAWTPPAHIAARVAAWVRACGSGSGSSSSSSGGGGGGAGSEAAEGALPPSGTIVEVLTAGGATRFEPVAEARLA